MSAVLLSFKNVDPEPYATILVGATSALAIRDTKVPLKVTVLVRAF